MLKFTNLLGINIISAFSLVDQNITKEKIPLENNLVQPRYSIRERGEVHSVGLCLHC